MMFKGNRRQICIITITALVALSAGSCRKTADAFHYHSFFSLHESGKVFAVSSAGAFLTNNNTTLEVFADYNNINQVGIHIYDPAGIKPGIYILGNSPLPGTLSDTSSYATYRQSGK